jgi:hypothetical protein
MMEVEHHTPFPMWHCVHCVYLLHELVRSVGVDRSMVIHALTLARLHMHSDQCHPKPLGR